MARTKQISSSSTRSTVGDKRAIKRLHSSHKKKYVFNEEIEDTVVPLTQPKQDEQDKNGDEKDETPKKHRRVNRLCAAIRRIKHAAKNTHPI